MSTAPLGARPGGGIRHPNACGGGMGQRGEGGKGSDLGSNFGRASAMARFPILLKSCHGVSFSIFYYASFACLGDPLRSRKLRHSIDCGG